jgi:hypothetical protein
MRLTFSRRSASVDVEADDATMAWLVARTLCYGFSTASSRSCWLIVAGADRRGEGDWVRYDRRYPSGEACSFLVDLKRRVIAVDAPSAAWRELYTLRMIRNVMRWELLQRGAYFIHGSCVSASGQGLCMIGPSRSGKSSLILSALQCGGWDFLTEDDLTAIEEGERLVVLGWPGSVRVRRSMLPLYPEILAALPSLKHPANSLEEKLDPNVAMVRIFPEELAAIYGCGIVGEAKLSAWGIPQWSQANAIVPLDNHALEQAVDKAWDILPERRAGAPVARDGDPDWEARVFDPFLLKYYGLPPVSAYRKKLSRWTQMSRGYLLCHSGNMGPSLWSSLLESISGGGRN